VVRAILHFAMHLSVRVFVKIGVVNRDMKLKILDSILWKSWKLNTDNDIQFALLITVSVGHIFLSSYIYE